MLGFLGGHDGSELANGGGGRGARDPDEELARAPFGLQRDLEQLARRCDAVEELARGGFGGVAEGPRLVGSAMLGVASGISVSFSNWVSMIGVGMSLPSTSQYATAQKLRGRPCWGGVRTMSRPTEIASRFSSTAPK